MKTKRVAQLLVLAGFAWAAAAWAGTPAPSSAGNRQLVRSQAEVKRLKQDLDRQEAHNQQAGKRMQEQDRTIADLRRQLQEVQAGQAGDAH